MPRPSPTRRPAQRRMLDRRLSVAGEQARVVSSAGGSPGESFLLVHGVGMTHRSLARLHDALAERGDVHSVVLPGLGDLPRPSRDLDVAAMAAVLAGIADELRLDRLVVVGHSMGAQWAVELGVQRPDLVRAVVAVGPVTDDRHPSFVAQAAALAIDTMGEPPSVNAVVLTDYVRCGMPWYLAQVRHMLDYPLRTRVAELAAPLLVVRGGDDPIAGLEWCRRLRDAARAGSLAVVPTHNHVVPFTAPRAVASAVAAFLDRGHV